MTFRHFLLLSLTDTTLELAIVDTFSNLPYANAFSLHEFIEVRTTDKRSNQVSIRHSYHIDWHSKPWFVGSLISKIVTEKGQSSASGFRDFAVSKTPSIVAERASHTADVVVPTLPNQGVTD